MYEHDLSSWVNFYTLFRPEDLHQFVEKTEDDYHRAKEGINAFAQLLSSDCVVRYGERHIQGWEFRSVAGPYIFEGAEEFRRHVELYELTHPWLNCRADYLENQSKCTDLIKNDLPKWIQFRAGEKVLQDKTGKTMQEESLNLKKRLIPSFAKVHVVSRKHYEDLSVVVLDFDRRVILPNEDGVTNLSEIQFELWSRDRQPPQSLTQDIVSERITVVHKFDSTGKVTEWNWNYENNDISKAFPVDTEVKHMIGRHFQRVYQRMNECLMDKVMGLNEKRIEHYQKILDSRRPSRQLTKTEEFDLSQLPESTLEDKIKQLTEDHDLDRK